MAIDPTIALRAAQGVPQFDPMAAAEKGLRLGELLMRPEIIQQQLASARAAEQSTIASTEATRLGMKQTEQQIAQAELVTQRNKLIEESRKRASEVAKQFSKVDPKTGKVSVDYRNVFNTLALEGHDLDTAMNYAQKADVVDAGQLKTDIDRLNYAQNRAQGLNEILRVQSDPARAQQIHDAVFESVSRLSGPEAAANAFSGVFGNARQSGDLIGQAKVTSQAQISPATAEQLKISQEQLRQGWANIGIANQQLIQAGAANLTGPEALDPKSNVSKAYRELALKAGVPASQVENLSAAQIHRIPGISDQVTANIVPAGTRAAAAVGAVGSQVNADLFDKVAKVADKIKGRYPELTPANFVSAKVNQLIVSDPDLNEYVTLVRELQSKGFAISENQGPKSIANFATGQAGLLRKQGETQGKLATSPTFTESPVSAAETVQVKRLSDGAVATIPKDKLQDFLRTGRFERV
jgi:hypothetical protein